MAKSIHRQDVGRVFGNGANVSGFREQRRKAAANIHPGDYLICYLTGVSRLIGVLEVKSELLY